MMNFLRNKLWRNKWLVICLIMGNVLLIGITTGTPIYVTATVQRIFQQDLRSVRYARNMYPSVVQLRFSFNAVMEPYQLGSYNGTNNILWPAALEGLGISSEKSFKTYIAGLWHATPYVPRHDPPNQRPFGLVGTEGFADHIQLTHGRMPSDELVDGNIIEALAMGLTMSIYDYVMDELMVITDVDDLYLRIVGVFDLTEGSDDFWSIVPINFESTSLLVSDRLLYNRFVRNYIPAYRISAIWTEVLDFTEMHVLNIPHYQEALQAMSEQFNDHPGSVWVFTQNFAHMLNDDDARTNRLTTTLWILQLPIFVMLALYVYMVSRQMLQLDTNDISVIKSRGVSRGQILRLYALQGLFVGGISFPFGLALGVALCHMLGASNGFLEIVQRESLNVVITQEALLIGAVATSFSFLTMFLPVIRFSKVGIVEQKRTKTGKLRKPFWQRYFIDFVFFGVACYGLYAFGNTQELMSAALIAEAPGIDPLLYISSSLFILGIGLICLRIFPYVIKVIFVLGQRLWSPAVYASMLKIIRSSGEEQFIMLFLIFSVSIGIYSAQAARTININNAHQIQHTGGTDLVFLEQWHNNVPCPTTGLPPPDRVVYFEPDFGRFLELEEIDYITQVIRRHGSLRGRGRIVNDLHVMSIDTPTFGETVWFRDDLLQIHINYFLNTLARIPNGVLLSDNFRTSLEFEVGDVINLVEDAPIGDSHTGQFVVVGFLEHWPAFNPMVRNQLPTREVIEVPQYLAVINLAHTVVNWGLRPYQVWMRTNTETNQFLYDFIDDNGLITNILVDTKINLIAVRSDPIVQGTNGVLTVGFIVILLVCFSGFLIYWILSIRSRVLQFGILRAMGMSMRNIINLLVNEQVFITLTALAIGTAVGEICARLFVPLVQISYTTAEQAIPILVVVEAQDYGNLFATLAITIVLCLIVLIGYISRIKIDQAIKLGED